MEDGAAAMLQSRVEMLAQRIAQIKEVFVEVNHCHCNPPSWVPHQQTLCCRVLHRSATVRHPQIHEMHDCSVARSSHRRLDGLVASGLLAHGTTGGWCIVANQSRHISAPIRLATQSTREEVAASTRCGTALSGKVPASTYCTAPSQLNVAPLCQPARKIRHPEVFVLHSEQQALRRSSHTHDIMVSCMVDAAWHGGTPSYSAS